MAFSYYNFCAEWDPTDVNADGVLCDMIDAGEQISRETFLREVVPESLREIEQRLGYATTPDEGLVMEADYHVTYHHSMLHGKPVVFFVHSAIEYVFAGK